MPAYIVTTSTTATGLAYSLNSGDTLYVPQNIFLAGTSTSSALILSGGGRITVAGAIYASGYGAVALGSATVMVDAGGSIIGETAAFTISINTSASYLNTNLSLINRGSVVSRTGDLVSAGSGQGASSQDSLNITNYGLISVAGAFQTGEYSTGAPITLLNYGEMTARTSGYAFSQGTSTFFGARPQRIENHGAINSAGSLVSSNQAFSLLNAGVFHAVDRNAYAINLGTATAAANLFNSGDVLGAVSLGTGADILTNTGVLNGDVSLGGGANVLTNTGSIFGSITGGGGADTLNLARGSVTGIIVAGLGADTVIGSDDRDVIYGDDAASTDTAGGADVISAGRGDDLVFGGYGNDTVSGGYGADVLNGGYGGDALYGNQDDDVLYGNQGDDWLHGGQGDDTLYGGQGNDTVNGGVGDDVLYGNLGDDRFVLAGPGFGHDVVADFNRTSGNMDVVEFGPGVFASFADLQARATQTATGVLLTDAAGDTVLIVGATTGGLTADMFVIG